MGRFRVFHGRYYLEMAIVVVPLLTVGIYKLRGR